jgi:hypothetical protein
MPAGLAFGIDGYLTQRFPDRFFLSKHWYSRLLLTARFYRAFSRYEYLLIHQLDSLVFSDDLQSWCELGYDYIGGVHTIGDLPPQVGNGGFSLRKTSSFLKVLRSNARAVDPRDYWMANWADKPLSVRVRALPRKYAKHLRRFNDVRWEIRRLDRTPVAWPEDWFWSLEAKRFWPPFRIAPNAVGDRFAFCDTPRECFAKTGRLPFGCHGWTRHEREFWEPHLLPE